MIHVKDFQVESEVYITYNACDVDTLFPIDTANKEDGKGD